MEKRYDPNLWPGGDGGSFWYMAILGNAKLSKLIRNGYPPSLEAYGRNVNPYRPPYQGLEPTLGAAALLHVILYSAERLFSRDWFHRIWVLQEIILAPLTPEGNRLVTVFMGHTYVEWNELVAFAYILSRSTGVTFSNHDFFRENWSQLTVPPKGQSHVTYCLDEYIKKTMSFTSSDPRDRLFALLPLSADVKDTFRSNSLLQPDYSKSLASVLTDYRKWRLGIACQTIDILSFSTPWEAQMSEEVESDALNETQDSSESARMSLDDECDDFEGFASASGGSKNNKEGQARGAMPDDGAPEANAIENKESEIDKDEGYEDADDEDEDDTTASEESSSGEISVSINCSEDDASSDSYEPAFPLLRQEPLDYLFESGDAKSREYQGMPSWVTNIWSVQDHKLGYSFEEDYESYSSSKNELAVVDIQTSRSSIFLMGLPLTKIAQAAMARHGPQSRNNHEDNSDDEHHEESYDIEWDIGTMWDRVRTESIELRRQKIRPKHNEKARYGAGSARTTTIMGSLWRRQPLPPGEENLRQVLLTSARIHRGSFTTGHPSTARKRIFTTTDGDFVLAPEDARPNDLIVVLFGSRLPLLLRRDSHASAGSGLVWRYRILGPCFFHGDKWMKGKELAQGALDHVPKRFYELV
ncbi:hypothetical protein EKO04_003830 [Ascochyta lentis]|uniref:Heterokaryon incompatibility domain-containing protein n=1 Tax=Ascochyta lentis TaxID=205686 RepID=A0A8H7J8D4_9PLEO|nr:hypothetical protein EKO04_003830 [Ascochyta lentis]